MAIIASQCFANATLTSSLFREKLFPGDVPNP